MSAPNKLENVFPKDDFETLKPESNEPAMSRNVDADVRRDRLVNHPEHYKQNPNGIEVIEVTRHLNFDRGNAVKCILRAGHKGDVNDEITDLEKAAWYINDEINRLKSERNG